MWPTWVNIPLKIIEYHQSRYLKLFLKVSDNDKHQNSMQDKCLQTICNTVLTCSALYASSKAKIIITILFKQTILSVALLWS